MLFIIILTYYIHVLYITKERFPHTRYRHQKSTLEERLARRQERQISHCAIQRFLMDLLNPPVKHSPPIQRSRDLPERFHESIYNFEPPRLGAEYLELITADPSKKKGRLYTEYSEPVCFRLLDPIRPIRMLLLPSLARMGFLKRFTVYPPRGFSAIAILSSSRA